ncbi:unnamed protein product [Alopecurus aequalis]
MFNASVRISIGVGDRVSFWEDPWIGGQTASTLAPDLLKLVRPGIRQQRSVQQGLVGNAWTEDIAGEISAAAVVRYFSLWNAIAGVQRVGDQDRFVWKWTANGKFSARSAYLAFFEGSTVMPGAAQVWHSFAPLKVRLHMWLALRDRCWTADRRLRRGLASHILCPLCTTANENMEHLTVQCVFSRSVWHGIQQRLGIPLPIPTEHDLFAEWWTAAVRTLTKKDQCTANSLIMLVVRSLWLERNARVFERVFSSVRRVIDGVADEWCAWATSRCGRSHE